MHRIIVVFTIDQLFEEGLMVLPIGRDMLIRAGTEAGGNQKNDQRLHSVS